MVEKHGHSKTTHYSQQVVEEKSPDTSGKTESSVSHYCQEQKEQDHVSEPGEGTVFHVFIPGIYTWY